MGPETKKDCSGGNLLGNEFKLGHESQRGWKPRTTVLARASRNLLNWTGQYNHSWFRISWDFRLWKLCNRHSAATDLVPLVVM
jgi:hypothetical protein